MTGSISADPDEETPGARAARIRREQRQADEEAAIDEAKCHLERDINEIRSGVNLNGLLYLLRKIRDSESGGIPRWGQETTNVLAPVFGEDIASAAREGFKAAWKNWSPPLPSERAGDSSVEHGVLVGLSGLAIAVADGLVFARLTAGEADGATRYALRELNTFPIWFEALVAAHPEVVRSVFSNQIEAELTANPGDPDPGDILSNIRYGPAAARDLCAALIHNSLATGDPPRPKALNDALDIVLRTSDEARHRLAGIARGADPRRRESDLSSPFTVLSARPELVRGGPQGPEGRRPDPGA